MGPCWAGSGAAALISSRTSNECRKHRPDHIPLAPKGCCVCCSQVQHSPHGHRQLLSSTTGNAPPIQAALHSPCPAPGCSIPSLHHQGLLNQQSPCFDQSHSTWHNIWWRANGPTCSTGSLCAQPLQHLKYTTLTQHNRRTVLLFGQKHPISDTETNTATRYELAPSAWAARLCPPAEKRFLKPNPNKLLPKAVPGEAQIEGCEHTLCPE